MASKVRVLRPHGSKFEGIQLHLHSEIPPHLSMMSYDGALLLVFRMTVLLMYQYSDDVMLVVHSFQIELYFSFLYKSFDK